MGVEEVDGIVRLLNQRAIQDRLNLLRPEAVLDLGCGDGLALAMIYHNHKPSKLVGIERWSESQVLSGNGHETPRYSSFYAAYLGNLKMTDGAVGIGSAIDFWTLLGLRTGLRIEEYLASCSEQFDLVLCSNVLHYIPKLAVLEEILTGIARVLSPKGLFYFRVIERPGNPPGWRELEDYDFDDFDRLVREHLGLREGYRMVNCLPHNSERVWTFCNF